MINLIKRLVEENFNEIVKIRRHLHKYPELSFHEHKTSAYIKSILTKWDIPFTDGIAETGVVVVLKGKNPDIKTVALRADFDALPIQEETDLAYGSVNQGVMHACGHDAHTASMLGALKVLHYLQLEWEGSIKFIFQPAEEQLPGGAQQMIKEGVLKSPNVETIIGQHVFPDMEVGKVGFRVGKYMASTDEVHIVVKGKGGHAALPQQYNNPLIVGARLILELDSFFNQYKDAPSVFAIGFIEGAGSTNVIPDRVSLKGTLRVMDEDLRKEFHSQLLAISEGISKEYNMVIDFDIRKGYPCLINDKKITEESISFAKKYLGEENVIELPVRMTAEDFSYYSQIIPSCFYRLGVRNEVKGIINGLHTSKFNIDEESLKIGMGLMAYLAIKN